MPKENEEKGQVFLEKENETLKLFVRESETKLAEVTEKLAKYEAFIALEDFDKVTEYLTEAVAYSELGSVEDVRESIEKLSAFEAVAETPETVTEMSESLKAFEELATPAEIEQAIESLAVYKESGILPEDAIAMKESNEAAEAKAKVDSIVESFQVSESVAERTLELFAGSVTEASEYLEGFATKVDESKVDESAGKEVDSIVGEKVVVESTPAVRTAPKTMLGEM